MTRRRGSRRVIAPDVGVGDEIARYYFAQLAAGVVGSSLSSSPLFFFTVVVPNQHFLHTRGVCHRDLKPENILLDAAGILKISDFGLSSVFRINGTGKTRMLTERCGSLPYVAPEVRVIVLIRVRSRSYGGCTSDWPR